MLFRTASVPLTGSTFSLDWQQAPISSAATAISRVVLFIFLVFYCLIISSAKVSLLKNKTNIPFITGNQPVINIKSEYDNTPAKEIQLYYPISPKLALLFDEKELFENPISVDDVLFYNEKIKQASEALIVGNKKETLENV